MSKTIGKVLQVATLVLSFVPGVNALVLAGLAAASFVNALLLPKAKQQARQASVMSLAIGETPREATLTGAIVARGKRP